MESDSKVFLAKRRWQDLYRRTAFGLSINEILSGNSWCNPSVRALFELAKFRISRRVWFLVGRETVEHVLEAEREAYIRNMDLGMDLGGSLTSMFSLQTTSRS